VPVVGRVEPVAGGGVPVADPGKGVCADPVNRDAILEGGGPGPPKRGQGASVERRQGKRKDVTR
jgi:hypothetical protein